jgi:sulfur-oxidizing protein SoxZ
MALQKPRIKLPDKIQAGDVIEIKTLITHPMETGQRKDEKTSAPVPRLIINTFAARFNGKEVFRMKLHPAIAANPYVSFFLKVPAAGELEFMWIEDGGASLIERMKLDLS